MYTIVQVYSDKYREPDAMISTVACRSKILNTCFSHSTHLDLILYLGNSGFFI